MHTVSHEDMRHTNADPNVSVEYAHALMGKISFDPLPKIALPLAGMTSSQQDMAAESSCELEFSTVRV